MNRGRETMNALMTLTMVFVLNVIKTTGDCPRYCECKWKSGKESVLCANANMTEVPRHLDSGTQLLDLTGNSLVSIGPDEFFNASLLNLQKIFLSRCRLRFIERSSFRKIINLVELDLSYNELHSVPSHTFEFITELRELRLNGNPIIRVLNNAFKMVPRLTKLDLSECRIGYVEVKAFQGLENSLEWLKLDKNKIVNIKPFALVNLGNLHGLELSGNPWNCSCGLRTLREWMLRQNVPYSIPPVCRYPARLADRDWDKLDLDEFACAPRIEATASHANGEEGGNVTLACSVQGVPEPRVRWLKKNHALVNGSGLGSSLAPGQMPKLYIVQYARDTSSLTILAADLQDNGVYVCRAENKAGKSEANVTLTVVVKPAVRIWSSRMIAAVGAVSLLFAVAVGLLTFCAWSSRKRKFDFRHSVGGRDYDADGYEMNHKKPINYNKIVDYGNHVGANSTTNTYRFPGKESRLGNHGGSGGGGGGGIGTEVSQGGKNQHGDFPGSRNSGSGLPDDGTTWDPVKISDVDDRLSVSSDSRLTPDLHIPRLNEYETRGHSYRDSKGFSDGGSSPYAPGSSPTGFLSNTSPDSRFFQQTDARREPQMTSYGTSVHDKQRPQIRGKYPDLLELSKTTENLINNNNNSNSSTFSTMPRKRSYKTKKKRHGSFGSESQSPLLPGSSGDSCDSNFSTSRRPSDCGSPTVTALPANPGRSGSPPEKSLAALQYKSWELENFLKEYQSLQDQLFKMRESCENLCDEDNVRFREGDEGQGVDTASADLMTEPLIRPHGKSISADAKIPGNEKVGNGQIGTVVQLADVAVDEEDNNNPKSILRGKKLEKPGGTRTLPAWPSNQRKALGVGPEPNSGNSFYQS